MKQVVLVLLTFACVVSQRPVAAQFPWGGGGSVGTAFSAEEHGMADIIRSQGMYNVMSSTAMINYETARGKYLDNERKWLSTLMFKKRLFEGERAKLVQDRSESSARFAEYRADHPDTPPRLYPEQFDSLTGQIKWPLALQHNTFAIQRQEMEELFSSKARLGSTSTGSQAIFKKTREMEAELRKIIRDFVPEEYIAARKFLRSLEFEGKTATD